MADDVTVDNGGLTDYDVATDDDGLGNHVQIVKLALSADGSRTPITADANGMLVNLGTNNDVTLGAALPAGTNNIGDVDVLSLPAIPAGTNNIGDVDVASIAAGDNNIGNVDIVTMPNVTLAAGTNTNEVVGDAAHDAAAAGNPLLQGGYASAAAPTDVTADGDAVRAWHLRNGAAATVITAAGALVGGDAANGLDVDVTRLPSIPAGTNNIGDVDVLSLPAIPAGTNNIGDVDVASIAAGDNNIGNVDIVTMPNVTLAAGTNTNEVVGDAAHDAAAAGNPVLQGGYASAAAPTDVTADGDAVRSWHLRNGAQATVLTAAGALVGGDATNGLDVDVTRLPSIPAGSNNIGDVDVLTLPSLPAGTNNIGDVDVLSLPAIPAGTNNIGDVDVLTLPATPAGTNLIGAAALGVSSSVGTGASSFDTQDLDETEEEVKGSAGKLHGYYLFNAATSVRYFKFYANTGAGTTVGTTTPLFVIPVPAGSAANLWSDAGIAFATGITVAATTGSADSDTGAPAANECMASLWYI